MFHPFIQVFLAVTVLRGAVRSQMEPACAGAPNDIFVRNSMSCSDYYHCIDEIPSTGRCPKTFNFDAATQSCNIDYSVDCTQCSSYGIQNIEDPNDCRRFYRCVAGQRSHRTCADNLVFDPSIGDCNVGNAANCSADSAVCRSLPNIVFLRIGDPNDCTKFYNCLNGVTYSQSCANGLYFNAFSGNCEMPGSFNFCQDFGPIINGPFSQPLTPAWPALYVPDETPIQLAAATTPAPRLFITQPPIPVAKLPIVNPRCSRPAGYFSVAGSCVDYVYCLNGEVLFEFTCNEGYWYNPETEFCSDIRPEGC